MGILKENVIKKIILSFCFISIFFSCNNERSEYDKNLNHFKNLIKEINNYFTDTTKDNIETSNYYTEDFIFYSYPAGHKQGIKTTKVEYLQGFNQMKKGDMLINIGHSIYLPGIDKDSHELDGSVRVYYGATISMDTSSVEFSGYQTVDFRDGKISTIWEWADYGGVNNQLTELTN